MSNLDVMKKLAIEKCLEVRKNAVVRKTQVGAALYGEDIVIARCNYENRCHKGYHAEESAVLQAQFERIEPKAFKGIVISFGDSIEKLTFMCGHCRQIVWEYTLNPDLLVSEVDVNTGEVLKEMTLGELYPYPYPRGEKASIFYDQQQNIVEKINNNPYFSGFKLVKVEHEPVLSQDELPNLLKSEAHDDVTKKLLCTPVTAQWWRNCLTLEELKLGLDKINPRCYGNYPSLCGSYVLEHGCEYMDCCRKRANESIAYRANEIKTRNCGRG